MDRGMELRAAVPSDAMGVAHVHVRAWQDGYRGLMPDAYLDQLRPEERAARYTFGRADGPQTTVAIRGGVIAGFATIITSDDGAELAALNVDPAAWRTGVGTALIAHARAQLAATGATEAVLWMLVGNARAQAFYERDGWRVTQARRQATVWGATVDEVALRRPL